MESVIVRFFFIIFSFNNSVCLYVYFIEYLTYRDQVKKLKIVRLDQIESSFYLPFLVRKNTKPILCQSFRAKNNKFHINALS